MKTTNILGSKLFEKKITLVDREYMKNLDNYMTKYSHTWVEHYHTKAGTRVEKKTYIQNKKGVKFEAKMYHYHYDDGTVDSVYESDVSKITNVREWCTVKIKDL